MLCEHLFPSNRLLQKRLCKILFSRRPHAESLDMFGSDLGPSCAYCSVSIPKQAWTTLPLDSMLAPELFTGEGFPQVRRCANPKTDLAKGSACTLDQLSKELFFHGIRTKQRRSRTTRMPKHFLRACRRKGAKHMALDTSFPTSLRVAAQRGFRFLILRGC